MKDLVKVAKTVVAAANPYKEKLETNATELKEKFSTYKVESKNEKIKTTKESILSAANKRLENYEHKKQKQEIDYKDLSVEITHAKYNASLLELDAKTMQYTLRRDIDLTDAVNQSREFKKRLRMFLTACAHKDSDKLDKALAALQQHIKRTDPQALTVGEIQKIMNHATPTQANYFKRFAHILGVVKASRSNAVPMEVNKESAIYQDFKAL